MNKLPEVGSCTEHEIILPLNDEVLEMLSYVRQNSDKYEGLSDAEVFMKLLKDAVEGIKWFKSQPPFLIEVNTAGIHPVLDIPDKLKGE